MFEPELNQLKKDNLLRRLTTIESSIGPEIVVNGRKMLLMCSNDYLGLSGHTAIRQAAVSAVDRYGFGSGASRLVSGTSELHRELEDRIAQFKKTENALLFNSGYAANTGVIPALAGEGDVILSDALNHASIIDGCRLSRANIYVYQHRDVDHAEMLLKAGQNAHRRLIITDGVFSMDGDIAPLPELAFLAEKYNAVLMVDDAHGTGVLGKNGRGSVEHFGLEGRIHIQMGTFGKALGSFGAFIAGTRNLIDYLVNKSRSFIYSTALPPAVCAASLAALEIVEREPVHREQLWKNRERFLTGLRRLKIDTGPTETQIVPLMLGDPAKAVKAGERFAEQGIFASAIRPPSVPEGSSRIRTTIMSTHSGDHIDRALDILSAMKQEGYF